MSVHCNEVNTTTGIRLFAECFALCQVLFVGHSAKKPLPSAGLGKVLLSVTSAFTESRTLGTVIHSANGGARQRAVSSRL
jgi:hypothetical protein